MCSARCISGCICCITQQSQKENDEQVFIHLSKELGLSVGSLDVNNEMNV